jgi:hypothetical protein
MSVELVDWTKIQSDDESDDDERRRNDIDNDVDDDDDDDDNRFVADRRSGVASSTIETAPNADGVKQVISFTKNADGKKCKVTKFVKVTKEVVMVPKDVIRRREHWKKFGAVRFVFLERRFFSLVAFVRNLFCTDIDANF